MTDDPCVTDETAEAPRALPDVPRFSGRTGSVPSALPTDCWLFLPLLTAFLSVPKGLSAGHEILIYSPVPWTEQPHTATQVAQYTPPGSTIHVEYNVQTCAPNPHKSGPASLLVTQSLMSPCPGLQGSFSWGWPYQPGQTITLKSLLVPTCSRSKRGQGTTHGDWLEKPVRLVGKLPSTVPSCLYFPLYPTGPLFRAHCINICTE